MKNRVSNGVFGKIVRTLGFILLLASSVIIVSELVLANTSYSIIAFAEPYAQMVSDIISQLGFPVYEYAFLGLIVGLLFLVWALRKGLILRLLISVLLVFVYAQAIANSTSLFAGAVLTAPAFINDSLGYVASYIDQALNASVYVQPGAVLALVFLLWALFANKKPKRFSVTLLRAGSIFLLLAVIAAGVPAFASISFFASATYLMITLILYLIAYIFFIAGSVFGVLGFGRS